MHSLNLFRDVGVAIVGAAVVGFPAYLAGFPLILAYLATGILLGNHFGLGLISNAETISLLSEIGLILLMFILGLEINIKKLLQAGKAVLVNGVIQFLACTLMGVLAFSFFGPRAGAGSYDGLYLAVAASLSSTLIVVKILSDRLELDSLTSRISLGVLVIQDLWAIGFLALQPNLSHLEFSILLSSIVKVLGLILIAGLMARFVLPRVFDRIGKQPELMLVTAMGWCFGICGIADYFGLSLEMGALVAGVSVASFPYHLDIAAKISSLRDFFITLFFVALGLQIPIPTMGVTLMSGAIIVFVFLSRFLTVFPTLYFLKYGSLASFVAALNLSQVSEFSLVLTALGVSLGHISPDVLSAFTLSLVVTTLFSSFLIPRSHSIFKGLAPFFEKIGFKDRITFDTVAPLDKKEKNKIVFLGFHREASSLLEELIQRRPTDAMRGLLVVDYNPEAHRELIQRGVQCRYGDISHMDTLRHMNLEEAEVLISTIPDHLLKGITNLNLLRHLRRLAPQAYLIMTAETIQQARSMYEEGANYVFVPRFISAYYLADLLESVWHGRAALIQKSAIQNLEKRREVIP